MTGGWEWKDKNGRVDSDAAKKATTDALTKLLSHLGFNADVFLKKFDDNKYVEQVAEEFSKKNNPPPPTITEDQRLELMALLDGMGVKVGPILKQASKNAGREIPDLGALPATEYDGLKDYLITKKGNTHE
jgi:hypothetical protein